MLCFLFRKKDGWGKGSGTGGWWGGGLVWILVLFPWALHDRGGKEGECGWVVVVWCLCFGRCVSTCPFCSPWANIFAFYYTAPAPPHTHKTDSPPRPRAARAGSARAAWRWTKALLRGSVGVNAWAPIRREDTKRADFMVASCSSSSGKKGGRSENKGK